MPFLGLCTDHIHIIQSIPFCSENSGKFFPNLDQSLYCSLILLVFAASNTKCKEFMNKQKLVHQ
jgi:hypothetical protein